MSLFIEEEGNIKLDFDTEEIAALVIDAALELADCPYEAEINLLLTENAHSWHIAAMPAVFYVFPE